MAPNEKQTETETDDYLLELMGLKADFPDEAMDAYGKIYSRYWKEMYLIAKNATKDPDTAKDLVADTFNIIFQRAHTFTKGRLTDPNNIHKSILKWMTTVMMRVFYDDYLPQVYTKSETDDLEDRYIIEKKEVILRYSEDYRDFLSELEQNETAGITREEKITDFSKESNNLALVETYLATLSERDRDIIRTIYNYSAPGKNTPGYILTELEEKWNTTKDNIRKILSLFRKSIKSELQSKLFIRKPIQP